MAVNLVDNFNNPFNLFYVRVMDNNAVVHPGPRIEDCVLDFSVFKNERCSTHQDFLRISQQCLSLQERVNGFPHSQEKHDLLLAITEKLETIENAKYVFDRYQVISLLQDIINQTRARSVFSEAYQRLSGIDSALQRAISAFPQEHINILAFIRYKKPYHKNIISTMEVQTWFWHDSYNANNSTFRLLVDGLNELVPGLGTMVQNEEQSRLQNENKEQKNRREATQVVIHPFGATTLYLNR